MNETSRNALVFTENNLKATRMQHSTSWLATFVRATCRRSGDTSPLPSRMLTTRSRSSEQFIYFYFVFFFKLFLSKNISSLDFLKIILKKKKCSELGSTTEVFPPSSTPYYRRQPTTGQRRKRRTNPQTNSPNHPSSSI